MFVSLSGLVCTVDGQQMLACQGFAQCGYVKESAEFALVFSSEGTCVEQPVSCGPEACRGQVSSSAGFGSMHTDKPKVTLPPLHSDNSGITAARRKPSSSVLQGS